MTQPIHTKQSLANVKLPQLKTIAASLGVTPAGRKTEREAWINTIIEHQASKVQKIADVAVEKPVTVTYAWDLTPPVNYTPAAICPDCDGHGCGNCNYRGTRSVDLCTPVDEYRLVYAAKTDTQTAYSAYVGDKFLGMVFKVRNIDEFWENTQKSYYWECGLTGQFWSIREVFEALEKRSTRTPEVVETPVSKQQHETLAREERAAAIEVVEEHGNKFVVQNRENGNCYVVCPNEIDAHQRCECLDCYHRGVKCKHQIAVERFINSQRLENLTSINTLESLLDKPVHELTLEEWRWLKEYEPLTKSEELVAA
ncbi:hypothetical protein VB735_23100 [Halotia wernerae UHCC 0503]|nr:hypothetical protein [Halotia wernerae UHCC 0503]